MMEMMPRMGGGGMGPWMMGWGGSGQAMCNAMAGHIEGRLAYIKAELKITDAQESLWNAYAEAARDNAKAMQSHCGTMMNQRGASTGSLPDRLDQHEELMAAQLDAVRAMNKALKPLYGALSDSQKRTADQLFSGPMGMM
ncbi:MAG: Spy/CpxP family protein refolding chaperone [Xanthobacteraceae bacterium]